MQNIDLTHIHTRIAELEDSIAESMVSREDAAEAFNQYDSEIGLKVIMEKATKEEKALWNLWQVHTEYEQLDRYKKVLTTDLMYCPCNYVVVPEDHQLVSPAGFTEKDRVFVQIPMAIHCNSLDSLPRTNYKMVAFDINKLAA